MLPSKSTVLGCLVGGAVGDAMGAPFEGLWSDAIPSSASLLGEYHEYHGFPRGQYTDDTQLTLATIGSIVENNDVVIHDIASQIAELWRNHSVIGPGGACTQAAEKFIANGDHVDMGAPAGQAGNGTAMRTAALGLWFGNDHDSLIATVAEVSRLTHRDPRSVAGGVITALAANLLASSEPINVVTFCDRLSEACYSIDAESSTLIRELPRLIGSERILEFIAFAGQETPEFDNPIITPFVIPTVLASLYCVLIHPDSWSDAVTTAIRLGGDVDTLGAIVGAISGARNGMESIPANLAKGVVDSESIQSLALGYHAAICSVAK